MYVGIKVVDAHPEMKDGREGYAVTYKDGYKSWSPKEAFEEAYYSVPEGYEDMIERNLHKTCQNMIGYAKMWEE